MSNFSLRPIDIEIRKKLLQKQRAFSRRSSDTSIFANAANPVTDPQMVKFFNRTTWAHLISLSVVKYPDGEDRLAIIGGGELGPDPQRHFTGKSITLESSLLHELDPSVPGPSETIVPEIQGVANAPLMRTSFEDIYRPFKDGSKTTNTLLKPISGIKSISTKYEGTLRARRDATVQFTIFSLEDLERLSPHFLRVGGEVLLEFGWNSTVKGSSYDFSNTLGSQIITKYHKTGVSGLEGISSIDLLKNNTAENYEKAILDLKGDYEYVLGTVKNFDYSLRGDGGFDCTIVITTIGMSLLDNKVNREESPSQILKHELLYVQDEKATDKPHTAFYHVIDNLPEVLTYSIINNYVSQKSDSTSTSMEPGYLEENISWRGTNIPRKSVEQINPEIFSSYEKGEEIHSSGWKKNTDAFSNWYIEYSGFYDLSISGELKKAQEDLKKEMDLWSNMAQALKLPRWVDFRDENTDEKYYYNYYTNEVYMDPFILEEELKTPEYVKPFIVHRQADIEKMLSFVDGGNYAGPWDYPATTDMGIYDYLNTKNDFEVEIEDYLEFVEWYWNEVRPEIQNTYGGIIEFLKYSIPRKKEIFKNIAYAAPGLDWSGTRPSGQEESITDYGPIDFKKAVETLVKMRTGEIEGYDNTSMTDAFFNQLPADLVVDTPPIDLSIDPVPEPLLYSNPNPAMKGNHDIFEEIYDRAQNMITKLDGIDSPDEDISTEGVTTRGEATISGGDVYKTIFVAYIQGSTIQALTGFNWDGGNFVDLAKGFCERMFSGKELGSTALDEMDRGFYDATTGTGDDVKLTFGAGVGAEDFLEGFLEGHLPKTWIRWGWFEDNIISKYLGFESLDTEPSGSIISPIGRPVSVFKSVEPKVNRLIVDGKVKIGRIIPGKYESNKIALPMNLKTTDVKEIIIPDRCDTLKYLSNLTDLTGKQEYDAKLYGMLGTILENGINNTTVPPAEVKSVEVKPVITEDTGEGDEDSGTADSTPEIKMGYIRNLLVEVTVLREAFLNVGSLREGMDNFFHILRRNFGPIHDFEIQPGRDDGMVGIVDNNLLYSLGQFKKPVITTAEISATTINVLARKMQVYEFPAWEKESIVKSQDLKVTIPDSMAVTALYAGNEMKANIFNTDKSVGSLKVQKLAKFLKLDETGNDSRDKSLGGKSNLRPLFDSKNLVNSGTGKIEYGMIKYKYSGDFYKKLSDVYTTIIAATGVQDPSYDSYGQLEKVPKSEGNRRESPDVWEVNLESVGEDRIGWYNPNGELGNPLNVSQAGVKMNYRRQMEYELEYDPRTQVQQNFSALNGLMSLGLTIDGTAGIFPGNSYISKYLPKAFAKRTEGTAANEYPLLFQATNIEHEITPSGWTTTITGLPRLNNKAFPTYLIPPKPTPGGKDQKVVVELKPPRDVTDGLSRFLNFFNLNHDFAVKSMDNIVGINPIIGVDDKTYSYDEMTPADHKIRPGSFNSIMAPVGHVFDGQITSKKIIDFKNNKLIAKVNWKVESPKFVSNMEAEKSVNPGYANYDLLYALMQHSETAEFRTIPEKVGDYERAKKVSFTTLFNDKIPGPAEVKYNPLEMMLFLQISSIITGITTNSMQQYFGQGGGVDVSQRTAVPPTISRVFFTQALADMVDWESERPKNLVGKSFFMKQIGDFLLTADPELAGGYGKKEREEKAAVYEYFGVGLTITQGLTPRGATFKDTFTWSEEIWGKKGPGRGNNFTSDDLARGLLSSYNHKEYKENIADSPMRSVSDWMKDPTNNNEINTDYILLGPINAGIPYGTERYFDFTIAFWNMVFAVILKNELGIPMNQVGQSGDYSTRAPGWAAFDDKLEELWNFSHEWDITDDVLWHAEESHVINLDSQKIFEHVLSCQYLIKKP